jgi:hypothetical protein
MTRIFLASGLALSLLVVGCASPAERSALRKCAFAPRNTRMISGVKDSMVVSVDLEIKNPGPGSAVVDSFQMLASTTKPLARLAHGKLRRIPAGKTDTVNLRFSMASADLLSTAFTFMMSPPDSIELSGKAWIPQLFGWWTSERIIHTRLPYKAVGSSLQGIFKGGLPAAE